jgi:hypothetical protein
MSSEFSGSFPLHIAFVFSIVEQLLGKEPSDAL